MYDVIVNAASKGDVETLSKALRGKFGEVTKENLNDCLLRAANMGNFTCVEKLLRAGADANAADVDGDSALKLAINNNYGRIGKLLIENGGDVNKPGNKGRVAIHVSAYHGNLKVTELLIEKGAKIDITDEYGDSPLIISAARGHSVVLRLLIQAQRSRRQHSPDTDRNRELNVALLRASATGKANCVRELLSAGAKVDHRDGWYLTPLICATQANNPEVLKVLLKAGADLTLTTSQQKDAFHYAIARDFTECVLILLEHGADPNGHDWRFEQEKRLSHPLSQSPIMVAIANGNSEVAKSLLQSGCHVNKNMKLAQLLYSAVQEGNIRLAKIMVKVGWNPSVIRDLFEEGVIYNDCDELSIWCHEVITKPRPMMEIARNCIAECLYQSDFTRRNRGKKVPTYIQKIDKLPLPTPMKKYLQYRDLNNL